MGRSHDGLGSPQETPHFPKDFAGFRMTEKKDAKKCIFLLQVSQRWV
jgi:hypothetical protein